MKMREKIARALVRANGANFDSVNPVIRDCALGDADAVLAAMREPTEEIIEAGWLNAPTSFGHDASDREMLGQWQAMIDAARES